MSRENSDLSSRFDRSAELVEHVTVGLNATNVAHMLPNCNGSYNVEAWVTNRRMQCRRSAIRRMSAPNAKYGSADWVQQGGWRGSFVDDDIYHNLRHLIGRKRWLEY